MCNACHLLEVVEHSWLLGEAAVYVGHYVKQILVLGNEACILQTNNRE